VGGVDVAVIHDEEAAADIVRRGCAKIVLSGHEHLEDIQLILAENGEKVFHLIGESAGGVHGNRPSLGPVQETAVFYAIQRDKETHQPLKYQTVSVHPDSRVSLSAPKLLLSGADIVRKTPQLFHHPVQ
jgi:hypothetical protein